MRARGGGTQRGRRRDMAAAGAAAAAAAQIQAVKASGASVEVTPETFGALVSRGSEPLVIRSRGGFFGRPYLYLSPYRGVVLGARADQPVELPGDAEVI